MKRSDNDSNLESEQLRPSVKKNCIIWKLKNLTVDKKVPSSKEDPLNLGLGSVGCRNLAIHPQLCPLQYYTSLLHEVRLTLTKFISQNHDRKVVPGSIFGGF
jgi:hypothetical protein